MENKVLESVSALTANQYQEILNQRGFINNHRWELMSHQRLHFLKCAVDLKTQTPIEGKLPSWVFVEELLGIKLNIPDIGIVGDYDYDTSLDVKSNLLVLAGQVKPEELANSKLLTEEDKSNLNEAIEKNFDHWKKDFITKRTSVFIASYDRITSNFGNFRMGILDKTMEPSVRQEAVRSVRNLYRLIEDVMEQKFYKENPNVKGQSLEEQSNKLSNYKFKNSPVNTNIKQKATTFVVYSNLASVVIDGVAKVMEVEMNDTKVNTLASFDLNETKMKGIISAERKSINPQFDIISVELLYDNNKTKMQAGGKDLKIEESEVTLPEGKVFELFQSAIPVGSFMKCYGMNIYPIEEFKSESIKWLVDNYKYFQLIPNERLEKADEKLLALVRAEAEVSKDAEEFLDNLEFGQDQGVEEQSTESVLPTEAELQPDLATPEMPEEDDIAELAKAQGLTEEQYRTLKEKGLL